MSETKGMSNYEKWCEQWRVRYLDMDKEELRKRLPELKEEGDYFTITQFNRKFGIHKEEGHIVALEDDDKIFSYEKLNIYTLFGYVQKDAHFKNEWVPFEKLKSTSAFNPAFQDGLIKPFGRMFDGKIEKLQETFERLGATKLSWADVGYEWKCFDCIPLRFLFWEGDEEFPSQGNILFDASATDFIHGESIVTIATVGLVKLAKEAGVEIDASTMSLF
ncbi:hypothetical protein P261_00674 [Lachnospiraceae bacterium TWA4]|nr:hypothetical protein P261_00674 [Lachnospiraceae bacterium TWA4]